jgi:carbon starvation protein
MPGVIALFGTFMIMVIILAVLSLDRGEGAGGKPVGHLHGGGDDPDRDVMGVYLGSIPPGAIGEVSVPRFVR